jgi:hypothetical protein
MAMDRMLPAVGLWVVTNWITLHAPPDVRHDLAGEKPESLSPTCRIFAVFAISRVLVRSAWPI